MAGTPIGRILLMPKGNYSGTAVYNSLDWVRYNGSAWVCTADNTTGIAPAIGVPEWQVLAQDGTVSGTVDWSNVNFKPFDTVGSGLDVDVSNTLKLDMDMLTGSNISYDNSGSGSASNNVQDALDELFNGGGGGGLLPYFFIDSEAGSTVTVNVPDGSTITPTAAGSGHWECSVPMYGTYTIHSVLAGQGDATVSVNVDDVKQYHITDNHFDFTINVTAPNGSTIRITGGTETYTGTGTGSSQAFAVHAPSTTYTIAVTMDGNTKSDTVTSAATTGQSDSVMIDFGTINVSVAADFVTAGSTITCVNGGTSCTPKTAASTLVFRVPTTGTWTISGSVSGTPYSVDAEVTSLAVPVSRNLETVPDGSTVLPTDDIQTWLNCAGIYDKTSYTTLADVLADSTTLLALMSDNNAVDYLVRSKSWITGKGLVPILTENTSSVLYSSDAYNDAWCVFDGVETGANNKWVANSASNEYVGYSFSTPKIVKKVDVWNETGSWANQGVKTCQVQYSDDNGATWTPASAQATIPQGGTNTIQVTETEPHTSWRLLCIDNHGAASYLTVCELQFYSVDGNGITDDSTAMTDIGANNYAADTLLADSSWFEAIFVSAYMSSVLNVYVPTLSADSSSVIESGHDSTTNAGWHAFDGSSNTGWYSNNETSNQYIGYDFGKSVDVYGAQIDSGFDGTKRVNDFKIQGSDDKFVSDTNDIYTGQFTNPIKTPQKYTFNKASYSSFRFFIINANAQGTLSIAAMNVQFWGREDV